MLIRKLNGKASTWLRDCNRLLKVMIKFSRDIVFIWYMLNNSMILKRLSHSIQISQKVENMREVRLLLLNQVVWVTLLAIKDLEILNQERWSFLISCQTCLKNQILSIPSKL
jgi:hypothetical protein